MHYLSEASHKKESSYSKQNPILLFLMESDDE